MTYKNGLMALAGILFVTGLVGCGSVSSTGSSEYSSVTGDSTGLLSSGTTAGKVGILIKDDMNAHPSDGSKNVPELSQLWVTIKRVSLQMESDPDGLPDSEMDDEGWLTVFEGTARYDLLTLQDNKSALMALVPLPADKTGYYEKARIDIDESSGSNCFYLLSEGVADDPLYPCTDSDAYLLNVPSGKIDIGFHQHIYLGPDTTQYIVFDLLPAESIKITDTNGPKDYLLRPVIHAYTMPSIMEDNGWDDMKVEEFEGHIVEISGCDNPDILPDTLVLLPEHGGVNINIDITGTVIYHDDSDDLVTCSSLQPGQEVEVRVSLSSDGTMTADMIEIEELENKGVESEDSGYEVSQHEESMHDWD